jgi:plasmid replication initiation protein
MDALSFDTSRQIVNPLFVVGMLYISGSTSETYKILKDRILVLSATNQNNLITSIETTDKPEFERQCGNLIQNLKVKQRYEYSYANVIEYDKNNSTTEAFTASAFILTKYIVSMNDDLKQVTLFGGFELSIMSPQSYFPIRDNLIYYLSEK